MSHLKSTYHCAHLLIDYTFGVEKHIMRRKTVQNPGKGERLRVRPLSNATVTFLLLLLSREVAKKVKKGEGLSCVGL
jgi:hypothetical protein